MATEYKVPAILTPGVGTYVIKAIHIFDEIQNMSQDQLNALAAQIPSLIELVSGITASSAASAADQVQFDNTGTGLTSVNVQSAIEELLNNMADASNTVFWEAVGQTAPQLVKRIADEAYIALSDAEGHSLVETYNKVIQNQATLSNIITIIEQVESSYIPRQINGEVVMYGGSEELARFTENSVDFKRATVGGKEVLTEHQDISQKADLVKDGHEVLYEGDVYSKDQVYTKSQIEGFDFARKSELPQDLDNVVNGAKLITCSSLADSEVKVFSLEGTDAPVFGMTYRATIQFKNTAQNVTAVFFNQQMPMFYNDAAVSETNSWEDGDCVELWTDGINLYARDIELVQTTGQSTSAVMSQKAVTNLITEIITDRALYMLEYILKQAIYISDQSYNIGYFLSTFRDVGDVVSVPDITQDVNTRTITISADEGATVFYTIDGSIPTSQSGVIYSEPFVPIEDCVVKAIAYGNNNSESLIDSLNAVGSGIIVFKDANLEAVAKAATTDDVVVTLPDSTTTTVKGLGWDKDHDGVITLDDMRQVTSLRSFNSQKWIQYLDVLKYTRFTSMDTYQFFQCSNLKELNIPSTCRTTKGINQCTSLQKLIFEEGVTNVGEMNGCTITSMKLPDSLTTFGGMSNCGTSLRSTGGLVIPKNVTAFPKVYNTKVGRIKHLGNITTIPMGNISYAGNIEVYLASNTVPSKSGTASQGTITKLYVPDEMIPLYAESADWASLYSSGKIVSINNWVD